MTIKQVTVTFNRDDLLSSLWYDDGSGMRHGIEINSPSYEWKLASVSMDGEDVTLVIERLEQKKGTP